MPGRDMKGDLFTDDPSMRLEGTKWTIVLCGQVSQAGPLQLRTCCVAQQLGRIPIGNMPMGATNPLFKPLRIRTAGKKLAVVVAFQDDAVK